MLDKVRGEHTDLVHVELPGLSIHKSIVTCQSNHVNNATYELNKMREKVSRQSEQRFVVTFDSMNTNTVGANETVVAYGLLHDAAQLYSRFQS